jgi:4'-phosphopantetheinyl transferase
MTDILYIDVAEISDVLFLEGLASLPKIMEDDVLRYKFAIDRKLKLFGRLLVAYYFEKNGVPFSFDNWQIDQDKKPFIPNGKAFNLSRSGTFVIAAFSDTSIGIDIELKKEMDFEDLIGNFHSEEQTFYRESNKKKTAFYNIWTRKEAFLKAKGLGIIKGLSSENCLNDSVQDNGIEWHINSIDFSPEYALAIASNTTEIHDYSLLEIKWKSLKN